MRIAVCFSGLIRTGVNCVDNIKCFLGDMLPYCDFFLHTWDYETHKPFARTHWNNIPLIARTDGPLCQEKLHKFIDLYNIKSYKVESYSEFIDSWANHTPFPIVWHSTSRSFELKRQYELDNNFQNDIVIKIRPDVIFPRGKVLSKELLGIDLSLSSIYSDPHTDNRLDDVFWITNSQTSNTMIELIKVPGYQGQDFNKDVLKFMAANNISHSPISAPASVCYSIYRYESYMFDPMINFRECFMSDLIHYSNLSDDEIIEVFKYNDIHNQYEQEYT